MHFPAFGLALDAEDGWLAVRGGQRPIAPSRPLSAAGRPVVGGGLGLRGGGAARLVRDD